jgi:hypothetical protein
VSFGRRRWAFPSQIPDEHGPAVERAGYEFTFYGQDEIGPRMLARVAKRTGFETGRSLIPGTLMLAIR